MINYLEPHLANTTAKLNWLRASVLGANDGIVSIAGLVLGIAGATDSPGIIFTAGMTGIIAGAISMAAGEYVSVSSSRDTERALIKKERKELREHPEQELEELILIYERKGLSKKTATTVANELTKHDPIAAHLDAELNLDPENLTNPWHAAFASASSFLIGGIIPLMTISTPPLPLRIPATVISVVLALAITGSISASIGGASIPRATARVVLGGIFAMAITYSIGRFFGISGI
ncbi:VIT family protein [Candidatus Daviesbacteria bacterium]|nr:VIT family protein [Candidatus Daviesbacteria bacterium]